jgi:hypothetical protein
MISPLSLWHTHDLFSSVTMSCERGKTKRASGVFYSLRGHTSFSLPCCSSIWCSFPSFFPFCCAFRFTSPLVVPSNPPPSDILDGFPVQMEAPHLWRLLLCFPPSESEPGVKSLNTTLPMSSSAPTLLTLGDSVSAHPQAVSTPSKILVDEKPLMIA